MLSGLVSSGMACPIRSRRRVPELTIYRDRNALLRFDNTGVTIGDAKDIVVGATTGTKIGTETTQKIGFWNTPPVAQQVLATGASHAVDDVISLLQTLGLCRQS